MRERLKLNACVEHYNVSRYVMRREVLRARSRKVRVGNVNLDMELMPLRDARIQRTVSGLPTNAGPFRFMRLNACVIVDSL